MTTKITSAIWDDPDFMELLDAEKLCIFWVLTKSNLLGWVEATPRKLARDMEAPFKDLEAACLKLPRSFVITPRGVWCRNYIRKQFGYGQSLARSHMSKSLRKQIADAPEEIQKLILQEYPEIQCSLPFPPKELGSSLEATIEGEGEIEREIEGEEGGVGETVLAPPSKISVSTPPLRRGNYLPDDEFWKEMQVHYPYINIEVESRKMDAWLFANPDRKKTRKFCINWLNKIEPPLLTAKNPMPVKQMEPQGWQDLVTSEFPECNLISWEKLPESMKAWVREKQSAA
jgi:hypothetical protein